MRIKLPELSKKELFQYLVANKAELISQKKSMPIFSESSFTFPQIIGKEGSVSVKSIHPVDGDPEELKVKVVANTANWVDSHMDMLLPNAAKRSIEQRKGLIPHIHDHVHKTTAKLGRVLDILLPDLSFVELGIPEKFGSGTTQAIVSITNLIKSFNPTVFNQYLSGEINQHSIGLQYLDLVLAVNDEEFKSEFANFKEFEPQVINKEVVERRGFFWAVKEIRLLEISAVLFGSNEITPTLDNNLKTFGSLDGTQKDGPESSTRSNRRTILLT